MDILEVLESVSDPEWVMVAYELAVEDGDIETANKIFDAHPEIADYVDAWWREKGIELLEHKDER